MTRQVTLHGYIRDYPVKELLPYYLIAISYVLVLLSYPMPPAPGVVEFVMGTGLVAGCVLLLREASKLNLSDYKWLVVSLMAGAILVIYPAIHGVLNGTAFGKIARDMFPMVFLVILVPLIAYSASGDSKNKVSGILLAGVLCVGAISSIEFIVDMQSEYGSMSELSAAFDATYDNPVNIKIPLDKEASASAPAASAPVVQNMFSVYALHIFEPAVTFAAIYCGCLFFVMISRKKFILALSNAVVAAVALYGLTMLRLRAPVGLFVIAQFIFISYLAYKTNNLKKQLWIAFSVLLICIIVAIAFRDMLWGLVLKQHLVGTNGKLDEWNAVFGVLGENWHRLLIGIGWGKEFVPNYQLDPVRFTHSLFSFVLLKAGLFGLILLIVVYAHLMHRLFSRMQNDQFDPGKLAVFLASVPVILIGFLFQPTYKMLGFSVIVAMLLSWTANLTAGKTRQA